MAPPSCWEPVKRRVDAVQSWNINVRATFTPTRVSLKMVKCFVISNLQFTKPVFSLKLHIFGDLFQGGKVSKCDPARVLVNTETDHFFGTIDVVSHPSPPDCPTLQPDFESQMHIHNNDNSNDKNNLPFSLHCPNLQTLLDNNFTGSRRTLLCARFKCALPLAD